MSISVSPGEWQIMELLWEKPQTLMELVHSLALSEGWAKSTVYTMVRRMESKGLIFFETEGRTKTFHPALEREKVVATETDSLLQRAYHGSVGLFLSAMTQRNALSDADIEELMELLREAKEK